MMDSVNCTTGAFLSILSIIIALLLQYWTIRRKELKSRINDLVENINELKSLSIYYWINKLKDSDAQFYELKIKIKFNLIQKTSSQLQKNYFSFRPNIKKSYINLKQAVTQKPFESRPHESKVGYIEIIESRCQQLENDVRNSQKKFLF